MIAEWIAAGVLTVTCAGGLVYWTVVGWRVARIAAARPTVRAGLDSPADAAPPSVSVVIPAHNEESVIDACATSLRQSRYDDLQVIFVLDRCTDGTRAILERHAAEDPRLELIFNESCPDEWAGKCHAAHLGAERATGELLLFTDADTEFDPDLIVASTRVLRDRELDLLSLLSTLSCSRLFERVAQPVASMQLIRLFPIDRISARSRRRPFANGQFMLFRRETYEQVGGHAGVRSALLEDLAFARAVDESGGECGVALADGLLRCTMYENLTDFRLGWKRIFIEACRRRPRRLRNYATQLLVLGVGIPLSVLGALALSARFLMVGPVWAGVALASLALLVTIVGFAALIAAHSLSGTPRRAVIWHAFGCIIVAGIMRDGALDLVRRRPIPWAGKQYILEPR